MSSPDKAFLDFYGACLEQEVKLHDDVARAGFFHANDGYRSNYAPNGVLAAIKEAGALLEDGPEPLADSLIVPSEDFNDDRPSQALAEIINASILMPIPEPGSLTFRSGMMGPIDNCSDAEVGFMRTAEALSRMSSDGQVLTGSQLFLHGGSPAFIRKAGKFPTAIGLKPTYINNIPYPAGSLYSIDFITGDAASYDEEETPDVPASAVEIYSVRQIDGIGFLRLSAFALCQAERRAAGFKPPYSADREGEPEQYFELELADFETAARIALERLDQIVGAAGRSALELVQS